MVSGVAAPCPVPGSMGRVRIVLGIGGGIAAYKAALLLRLLKESGHDVVPMPTDTALRFVGAPTWEALSGHPVNTSVFDEVQAVNHVRQAEEADLVLIAPATADLLARIAAGRADDLLSATVLTATCPVVLAPAMHTQMWTNPATRDNVDLLRSRGLRVIEPAVGRLTGADSGPGRLPEPADIARQALAAVSAAGLTPKEATRLARLRVLVTAGGTREALDPVRYLGNRSSGKQGIAVARAAADAGAVAHLVLAHAEVPAPQPTTTLSLSRVSSALQLRERVGELIRQEAPDVVVMAAAVADFRPAAYAETKIKKDPRTQDAPGIELVRNPDILRGIVTDRESDRTPEQPGPVIVGFAAETGSAQASVAELGRAKLESKGCDVLVVNEVGAQKVFGRDETAATILTRRPDGEVEEQEVAGTKDELAAALWRAVLRLIDDQSRRTASSASA